MLKKNLDFDINSKENLVNYFDNYLNNHGWNNTTQSEQAKLVRKSDMLEFKTRIIEMYLKEFEHNIYMLKKLNNKKTESDLLLYSINNVNNIINSLFKHK